MPIEEFRMRLSFAVFTALVTLGLAAGTPARAQDTYDVNMTNYAKIRAGTTYVTDLNENTELTSNAADKMRQALEKRGLEYDDNGSIGFKIGTERTVGARAPDAVFDSSNTILHLNFNSGDVKGTSRLGHIFRISLSVYDRGSGAVLARGDVTNNQPDADPIGTTAPMIEALLDRLEF
jgi:hypothetical protein